MIRALLIVFLSTIGCISLAQKKQDVKNIKPNYGFIENKGQVRDQNNDPRPDVKFIFSLPNNNIVLRANGFSYDTYAATPSRHETTDGIHSLSMLPTGDVNKSVTYEFHRVDISFVGGNPDVEIIRDEPSFEFLTYYIHGARSEIRVRHYGKLTYKNVYPGIDIEFVANPGESKPIEYNFIVNPGADMNQVQLEYNGAHSGRLANGQLQLLLEHGNLTEAIPLSYWKQSNKHANIRYKQIENRPDKIVVGFSGRNDRRNETLVIDPTPNLDWATYYGGTSTESGAAIRTDNANNLFMVGSTQSTNAIASSGSHQNSHTAFTDAFLVKFNASGVRQWATYYGGEGFDNGYAVGSDALGNVYLGGTTSSTDGIATPSAFQPFIAFSEESDGFLVKFNANGLRQWGTYIGYDDSENLSGIALDLNGDIYVCGSTEGGVLVENNEDLPGIVTSGAHQVTYGGGPNDAFLMKFDAMGMRQWGTFYGGTAFDNALDVTVDNTGNIFLVGSTQSPDMIASAGAHQTVLDGISNGFVAKFSSNGVRQWSTYYGSAGNGTAFWGIVSDENGNAYGTGLTRSASAIATAGSHQPFLSGTQDAFVVKFNSAGVRQWGTYYGGSDIDFAKKNCHRWNVKHLHNGVHILQYFNSDTNLLSAGASRAS